jgi:hypothetical protein
VTITRRIVAGQDRLAKETHPTTPGTFLNPLTKSDMPMLIKYPDNDHAQITRIALIGRAAVAMMPKDSGVFVASLPPDSSERQAMTAAMLRRAGT